MNIFFLTVIGTIASLVGIVSGSIQDIDVVIYPSDEYVQYTTAYIRVPGGLIDLRKLHFSSVTPSYYDMASEFGSGDDEYLEQIYEEPLSSQDDDGSGDGGGGRWILDRLRLLSKDYDDKKFRALKPKSNVTIAPSAAHVNTKAPKPTKKNKSPVATPTSAPSATKPAGEDSSLDIVVFPLPTRCSKDLNHCNWADLGVGMKQKGDAENGNDDELVWCCTEKAVESGLCQKESFGRLLIDHDKFHGTEISVPVPYSGCTEDLQTAAGMSSDGMIVKEEEKSATYVVMFSNCNTVYGHDVRVNGEIIFLSEHGYLPGELYGFMWFYTVITFFYLIIFLWFYCLMNKYKEYRIDIEKWIFTAISAGCIEMIFRTMDYYVWNGTGTRSTFVIWTGILAGVFKQAFSRCLIVMVSLGWGVIRNSLGSTMNVIIALGLAYVITLILLDGALLLAMEQVNALSTKSEENILNIVALLGAVKVTIDIIFIIWIFDALNKTMVYLSTQNNQSHKLQRTRNLLYIVVAAVLIGLAIAVVGVIDSRAVGNGGDGYIQEEFAWAKDAATELNYLFILTSIAILWRPNQSAREYAYAMELGSGEDEDDLELSAVHVPSAMDDDAPNCYTDDYNTNSRQIT